MASLYNRATPPQARVLRIIEGAVHNAAHAHPEIKITPKFARGVAKRAAGTLTAQWPDVLAAPSKAPSEKSGARVNGRRRSGRSDLAKGEPRGGVTGSNRAPAINAVYLRIARLIAPAKAGGDPEAAEALRAAATALGTLIKKRRKAAKT